MNQEYLNMVNMLIKEEVAKYAVPVYSSDYIGNSPDNISFTIEDELFLEVLFLRIRGETIKFASQIKKEVNRNEKELLNDIETLESNDNLQNFNSLLLDKKKTITENS